MKRAGEPVSELDFPHSSDFMGDTCLELVRRPPIRMEFELFSRLAAYIDIVSEELVSDEAVPDEVSSDKVLSDEGIQDHFVPYNNVSRDQGLLEASIL
jgi:hypothetical protein